MIVRTKPFTKLLKDAAKATRTHAAVLTGRVTKADVLRHQMSVQSSRGASRLSFPRSVEADPEVGIDAAEREADAHAPARRISVGTRKAVGRLPLTTGSGASNEGTSEPATVVLHNRLDEPERARIMEQWNRRSSIRAHMATFCFNTVVPIDVIQRFEPTQRTVTTAGNLIAATQEMMQLSQIWSRLATPAPDGLALDTTNPLRILSDEEAEKLCQLMERGLHRCAYWSLATELSVNEEEAVDDEWLGGLGMELDSLGRPDTEAIFQQVLDFGPQCINVTHLEFVMRKARCLDVGMSIPRRSTRRVPSTFQNAQAIELDAAETEIKRHPPTHETSVPSDPLPPPEEEGRHQLKADHTAHEEGLIFENRGESSIAERRCDLEEPILSSPGILEQLNAASDEALDEALDENAAVLLEPVEDDVPSPVTPPLTTKTNQSASSRRNGTWPRRSLQRKDTLQHEPAPSSLTRENGWISADVLAHARPEDFDVGALLPKEDESPRPAHLSERARGKLPTARSHSTRASPGQIVAPPYRGTATSQTLTRGMTSGKPTSKTQAPPVGVGFPKGGSTGQAVARPPFVAATRRSSSMAAKAKPAPKTSQALLRSFTTRPNSNNNLAHPSLAQRAGLTDLRKLEDC